MALHLESVSFDTPDPDELAQFWAGLLGRRVVEDSGDLLLPGSQTQLGLRFHATDTPPQPGTHRMHVHLTSTDADDQQRLVATALAGGARQLDVGQLPEEGHLVLVDPAGYEFCVIEPGNTYLAGCGLLGELACDGTRDVGLFWAAALDWPLVWEQDEETAVQSPRGGTKVAWGGPPVRPQTGHHPQRFQLTTRDVGVEVERLVALGATRHEDDDSSAQLADPDGNEFLLRKSTADV